MSLAEVETRARLYFPDQVQQQKHVNQRLARKKRQKR
ncbi:hypothetical protein RSK60_1520061 [Ralstonia solanacearum K60]|nr:hypothetical protein RSK60_1520061 [Ralstonia solanacearum K60]